MGWFGKKRADSPEVELDRGRQSMWRRDTADAVRVFDRLADDRALEPVVLAWRSLAHRMAGHTDRALADGKRAAKLAPDALEPRAALVAAHLTNGDVVASAEAFSHLKSTQAHDAEGHFLHLLCFALLYDCIRNMREVADGLQLDFNLTPSAEGAVLIFDGQLDRAMHRLTFDTDESFAFELAFGLATYREGRWREAAQVLEACLGRISYDNFNVRPALAAVTRAAKNAA